MRENEICALNFEIYLGINNICRITKVGSLLCVCTSSTHTVCDFFYLLYLLYEKSVTCLPVYVHLFKLHLNLFSCHHFFFK